jgi:membrane associated rhomboid family serine protease
MSNNVHGMSDFPNQAAGGNGPANRQRIPLLGGNLNMQGDPRKESFPSFLKNFCCPLFTIKSFIFCITIVDVIMYSVSISFGVEASTTELLQPHFKTLDMLGMLISGKIKSGQFWRWLTYAFLHADFVHLIGNVISRLMIGSFVEKLLGVYRVIALYLVTA